MRDKVDFTQNEDVITLEGTSFVIDKTNKRNPIVKGGRTFYGMIIISHGILSRSIKVRNFKEGENYG